MAPPRARHLQRPATRVRWNRVGALLGALGVTLVSILGGVGVLPVATAASSSPGEKSAPAVTPDASASQGRAQAGSPVEVTGAKFDRSERDKRRFARTALLVPSESGHGRRVVFDQTAQRVWLVGERDRVRRTYLVSGSVDDNLDPGRYEVYSRSMRAWGIDGGTMKYMVRFAHGDTAAIGFHDIPYENGRLMQTRAELGTARSSGCVRQARPDAKALWRFAPVGTKVVVVAT